MSNPVSFTLAPEYAGGGFDGGTVAWPDGSQFDVYAALTGSTYGGPGVIVLDQSTDAALVQILAGYPALVPTPEQDGVEEPAEASHKTRVRAKAGE